MVGGDYKLMNYIIGLRTHGLDAEHEKCVDATIIIHKWSNCSQQRSQVIYFGIHTKKQAKHSIR